MDQRDHTINFQSHFFTGKWHYNLFLMPHYANYDVISGQNKKFKMKYDEVLSHNAIKSFVSQTV